VIAVGFLFASVRFCLGWTSYTDDWKESGSVLEKPSGLEAQCKSDNQQHKSVPIRGVRETDDNSFWDIGKVTTDPPSNHAENEASKIEPKSTWRWRLIFDILINQQRRILSQAKRRVCDFPVPVERLFALFRFLLRHQLPICDSEWNFCLFLETRVGSFTNFEFKGCSFQKLLVAN